MKIIIEFQNPRLWETNDNCLWCKTIDDLYNDVLNSIDNVNKGVNLIEVPFVEIEKAVNEANNL